MSTRQLLLLGRHYTTLGPLALAELPDGGALALTRGAVRKAYRYVDPNEDAALLVRTEHGTLLAVADGYNGSSASEFAIESVSACAAELIQTPGERFSGRVEQLALDISAQLRALDPARSCLLIAVVTGRSCRWLSLGDSILFRSTSPDVASPSNDLVLDPRLRALPAREDFWVGSFELKPGERIAAVTDGVTNFVAEPAVVSNLLSKAASDVHAARAVASAAMRGGAGDNIGIATIQVA